MRLSMASCLKKNWEIVVISFIGFVLRIYITHLDPFLHDWDERFHALVAKNMMKYPLKPMLNATPVADYDPNMWCCNSVWLHKQPLFMWQMALSMKIFGVSEYTIRYPSALFGFLIILLTYRISILLTENKQIAIIASLLVCFSNYQLELISGRIGMDHNDMSFCFYTLASIWAYMEYLKKNKWYWVLLIGIFSGCAVLNKWLTGLLVYSAWGIDVLIQFYKSKSWKTLIPILCSTMTCCMVFLPWQFFILYKYPEIARYEYAYNSKHITEVVEAHSGSIFFYVRNFHLYFGGYIWTLGLIGLFLLARTKWDFKIKYSLVLYTVITFAFFSFVVKSKLPTYFFVVAPIINIFMAVGILYFVRLFGNKFVSFLAVSCCLFLVLNPRDLYRYRRTNTEQLIKNYNTNIYKHLNEVLPKGTKVIINVNAFEHTEVMFYNDGITAYHWWLSNDDIDRLSKTHTRIAAFENHGNYVLPDYIVRYPYLDIIPIKLR
ncbi:ArnT family glycosyltransferase [Taibaiella soli]|uniref:Glycosyltransferase RgtA/B/C/D-like domain-containing protein n=1 Tax=Taibaiella soli TaxID=1649169 RepID=A0A2W2AL10_9BACT|nr:glycosyltransferase family 39 protein [Taibaiella soli]PZF72980.1 hypothetical protein DN068_11250 [Taibaiella soli]